MTRDYVIVSTQYIRDGMLQFWGTKTKDDEKRSFGGYTRNLDRCERYTRQELKDCNYKFPWYRKSMNWRKTENFFIRIADLEKLGQKMTVIYF